VRRVSIKDVAHARIINQQTAIRQYMRDNYRSFGP
jgi:hypothetical protein